MSLGRKMFTCSNWGSRICATDPEAIQQNGYEHLIQRKLCRNVGAGKHGSLLESVAV